MSRTLEESEQYGRALAENAEPLTDYELRIMRRLLGFTPDAEPDAHPPAPRDDGTPTTDAA